MPLGFKKAINQNKINVLKTYDKSKHLHIDKTKFNCLYFFSIDF